MQCKGGIRPSQMGKICPAIHPERAVGMPVTQWLSTSPWPIRSSTYYCFLLPCMFDSVYTASGCTPVSLREHLQSHSIKESLKPSHHFCAAFVLLASVGFLQYFKYLAGELPIFMRRRSWWSRISEERVSHCSDRMQLYVQRQGWL